MKVEPAGTRGGELLDSRQVAKTLVRLTHEIAERHPRLEVVVLAGIRTRGVPLAIRLARALVELGQGSAAVVAIDVSDFRDDRPRPATPRPGTLAPIGEDRTVIIDGAEVIVVDDVLYTGRTLRAALDALAHHGRPRVVELLALVDRGHRELPLRATYVGKNVPTSPSERVVVRLREVDGEDGAWLVRDQGPR